MEQLSEVLAGIQKTYPADIYPLSALAGKFAGFMKSQMTAEEKLSALVKAATELTSQEAPKWENIAGNLLAFQFNSRLKKEEEDRKLWSFMIRSAILQRKGCMERSFWKTICGRKSVRQNLISSPKEIFFLHSQGWNFSLRGM